MQKLFLFDDSPTYDKIVAYWAFTEKYVASVSSPNLLKVEYEDLLMGAPESFGEVIGFLGGDKECLISTENNSVTTVASRWDVSKQERLYGWRERLSPEMQSRIQKIVADFWPEGEERWFGE